MSASTDRATPRLSLRRAGAAAGLILLLALGLRLAHVLDTPYQPRFDARSYLSLAAQVARSADYSTSTRPGHGAGGTRGPSAYFPPAYPYLLAAVNLLDGHRDSSPAAVHADRIAQAILTTLTVALIGLIALELLGPAAALLSAAIAAVYPVLIELTGILVAENLMTTLVLAALWCALRARHGAAPTRWLIASGGLLGLAALAHENAVLVVLPLAWAATRTKGWKGAGVLTAAALAAIAPWTIRNAVTLHHFVPISDETGITLVGAYNRASAHNPQVPYKWRFFAAIPGERRRLGPTARLTEPQLSAKLERQALRYILHHPYAPLAVAFHNTLRLLELEGTFAWRASAAAQGLSTGTARTGVISFWILALLALAGCLTTAARTIPRWVWWLPLLLALSVVLVNVETPRFRAPLDPFLILPAACALLWLLRRAPVVGQRRAASAAGRAQLVDVIEGQA